ncbi:2-C-methyl-D-erythritol 2,4-cyclodiphosphate synthase, partial [Escherichia coli]|nr:2-C-methyl-D-erythritol 2,4-cyclodiphosphate synthase [Escherichia coli]
YQLIQVSAVVTLDKPKLGPSRSLIQQNLARLTGLPEDRVGLTFKTSEGLAPDHVQCRVVVGLQEVSR